MMWVYALAEPGSLHVRYVGCSKEPLSRLYAHGFTRSPCGEWLRALRRTDREPVLVILEAVNAQYSDFKWRPVEAFWIIRAAILGHDLLNKAELPDWLRNPRRATHERLPVCELFDSVDPVTMQSN